MHFVKGVLYVIHDDDVDRTTDKIGSIYDMHHEEIYTLDASRLRTDYDKPLGAHLGFNLKIPTLENVLYATAKWNGVVDIELKGKNCGRPTAALLQAFISRETWWHVDRFIISSFLTKELVDFHEVMDNNGYKGFAYARLLRTSEVPEPILTVPADLPVSIFGANKRSITGDFVKALHLCNKEVMAWVVDNQKEANELMALGIDYIGTNRPDLVWSNAP